MTMPRIAVCVPTKGIVRGWFASSLAELVAYAAAHQPMALTVMMQEGSIIHVNREILVNRALDWQATHVLFVDDDMTFSPRVLTLMLDRKQPVVACNSTMRVLPIKFAAARIDGSRIAVSDASTGVEEADYAGFGVSLIETRVFQRTPKPWFLPTYLPEQQAYASEDVAFYRRGRAAGFPVLIDHDASKLIGHCGEHTYTWRQAETPTADTKVARARQAIESALQRHSRGAVLFSGGKESVVLAALCDNVRDKVELVWCNTGAMFPHMERFVRAYSERYKLVERRSDQAARFRSAGLPSRIIPIVNTPLGRVQLKAHSNKPNLADWTRCCSELRLLPAIEYTHEQRISLLIHGQRAQDQVFPAFLGAEVCGPLWDWTEADVLGYIHERAILLPEQYAQGYADSGECWNCTSEINPARFKWMATYQPEYYARLQPVMAAVYGAVFDELGAATAALQVAGFANGTDKVPSPAEAEGCNV